MAQAKTTNSWKRATYTIDYDPVTWRSIKMLAAYRGMSVRQLLHAATEAMLASAPELRRGAAPGIRRQDAAGRR